MTQDTLDLFNKTITDMLLSIDTSAVVLIELNGVIGFRYSPNIVTGKDVANEDLN